MVSPKPNAISAFGQSGSVDRTDDGTRTCAVVVSVIVISRPAKHKISFANKAIGDGVAASHAQIFRQ